jgi:hypothetical protein
VRRQRRSPQNSKFMYDLFTTYPSHNTRISYCLEIIPCQLYTKFIESEMVLIIWILCKRKIIHHSIGTWISKWACYPCMQLFFLYGRTRTIRTSGISWINSLKVPNAQSTTTWERSYIAWTIPEAVGGSQSPYQVSSTNKATFRWGIVFFWLICSQYQLKSSQ